jgi:hypothetical protein
MLLGAFSSKMDRLIRGHVFINIFILQNDVAYFNFFSGYRKSYCQKVTALSTCKCSKEFPQKQPFLAIAQENLFYKTCKSLHFAK